MAANGVSSFFTTVVQGKGQQGSTNSVQNQNTGNNTSVPVTGFTSTGGSLLSGNSVNGPQAPQVPGHATFGIGGNSNF